MIKVAHKREERVLKYLPVEVVEKAIEIATILDDNYRDARDDHDLGGYILIAEVAEDVETIKELIDFQDTLPEYVDLISCENGDSYTNTLMILSSDEQAQSFFLRNATCYLVLYVGKLNVFLF